MFPRSKQNQTTTIATAKAGRDLEPLLGTPVQLPTPSELIQQQAPLPNIATHPPPLPALCRTPNPVQCAELGDTARTRRRSHHGVPRPELATGIRSRRYRYRSERVSLPGAGLACRDGACSSPQCRALTSASSPHLPPAATVSGSG